MSRLWPFIRDVRRLRSWAIGLGAALASALALVACETDTGSVQDEQDPVGPRAEAESPEEPGEDGSSGEAEPDAGSGEVEPRLTRSDIKALYERLREQFEASDLAAKWKNPSEAGPAPLVTIAPFRNDVGGSVSISITSLVSRLETYLVNETEVDVASFKAYAGKFRNHAQKYDDSRKAFVEFGRKVGLDYVVSGVLTSDRDLTPETKRIEYTVTLRVLEIAEGDVAFETETTLRKGPKR